MSRCRKLILARRDGSNEFVFVRFDGKCVVVSENRKDAMYLSSVRHAQELLSILRQLKTGGEWEIVNLLDEGNVGDGVRD